MEMDLHTSHLTISHLRARKPMFLPCYVVLGLCFLIQQRRILDGMNTPVPFSDRLIPFSSRTQLTFRVKCSAR